MTISRFTKSPFEHPTVVLSNEGDPFKINVVRTPNGLLQIQAENYSHNFFVTLNEAEEKELLSKLKFT